MHNGSRYEVSRVLEVTAGDDLTVLVDLGVDSLYKKVRIRLKGVDAPNPMRAEDAESANKTRALVREALSNRKCWLFLHSEGRGGWIVTLYARQGNDTVCINQLLIDSGYVFVPANAGG